MTENILTFHDLMEQVLIQLKDKGYMDSTITVYRRFYNRVNSYLNQMNTDIYTKAIGDSFLSPYLILHYIPHHEFLCGKLLR